MKSWLFLLACFGAVGALDHAVIDKATNKTCIVFEANVTVTLTYTDNQNFTFSLNETVPNGKAGECAHAKNGTSFETAEFSFYPNGKLPEIMSNDTHPWQLELIFESNPQAGYAFKLTNYTLQTSAYDNYTEELFVKEKSDDESWPTDANAFKCSTYNLGLNGTNSKVELKNWRVIAFAALENTTTFPKEQYFQQCYLDSRTSEVVPIVVGASLAGLVILVLIAYLIGRARAKRQGYASV